MSLRRRTLAIVALGVLATGTLGAPAATARDTAPPLPAGAVDISATARGQKLIREARERYAERGHKAGKLRAVRDATGVLIAPYDTEFDTYPLTLENGRTVSALAPITADDPVAIEASVETAVSTAAAMSWSFIGDHCFTQKSDTWATLDHCYKKYKLANDGSSTYDWYALHRFGTAASNSPWVLDLARIRAYRYSGSPQTWSDWSPRGNWYGGSCSTASIGITSPIGGLSQSFERCPEQVTFTKSANGTQPDYTQTWFGLSTRGNRELNFEISVRVKQGGTATFTLPAEIRGSAY